MHGSMGVSAMRDERAVEAQTAQTGDSSRRTQRSLLTILSFRVSKRSRRPSHIECSGLQIFQPLSRPTSPLRQRTFEIVPASTLEQLEPPLPDMTNVADSRIAVTRASRSSCWSRSDAPLCRYPKLS